MKYIPLSSPYTMDSSQDELVIQAVEIVSSLNYTHFAVLAFLIYDTGESLYLQYPDIYFLYPH